MIARRFIAGTIIGIAVGASAVTFALTNNEIRSFLALDQVSEIQSSDQEDLATTLVTNDLKYAVLDVRKSEYGVNGERPLGGGIFVITKIEIENLGKTEVTVYGKSWYLEDSKGRIFKPKSYNAEKVENENRFSIDIPPGFKVVKDIGFEVPVSSQNNLDLYVADKSFDSKPILLGKII